MALARGIRLGPYQIESLIGAGGMGKVYKATDGGRRHGSTPGTVGLAGQRVPIRVPRIRGVAGREIPLRSYEALRGDGEVNDRLLTRVLYGISCRNYEAAADAIPGAIGLSGSTVSREFIQASAAKLRELQERDLGARPSIGVGRVASAVGPAARRADEAMPQRIVEEAQRGRWPHAAATRRARGGCGRRPRRTSSPMRCGIASSVLLVCSSQDPRARPTRILGRTPSGRGRRGRGPGREDVR